jgi:hypothetical protein
VRQMPPRRTALLGVSTLASFMMSGCFLADQGPSRLSVLNESGSTIWVDDDPANVDSRRLEVSSGDFGWVSTDACSEARVEAQDEQGEVIATLDREWCPGQLWVIRGADDWTLDDSP